MSYFISGLRKLLQGDVRAQNPITLSSAISLARIYEGKSQEGKKGPNEYRPNSFAKKIPTLCSRVSNGEDKRNNKLEFPIRRVTPVELQKRKEQGLCFHCDERYSFNHACRRLFWIEIEEENSLNPTIEAVVEEKAGDKP